MTTVVIVVHLMVVLAMIGLILLQRSEGGALGIGGGQNAFLTGRSAGNVLSHTTAYLAIAFFVTSLGLALIAKYQARPSDIFERLPGETTPASTEAPAPPTPMNAPTSAEELMRQLDATEGGPQAPPSAEGSPSAPEGSSAPEPSATTPAPAPTATEAPAPSAQEPPATPAPTPPAAPTPAPATPP
jgi:preprotein translocase subunit SecG